MKNKESSVDEFEHKNSSIQEFEKAQEDAEAEQSDIEFVEKSNSPFKFVNPPSSHESLLKTISEADARYEASKSFLQGNLAEAEPKKVTEKKLSESDLKSRLPPNFMISTLNFPITNSEVILCGVDNRSYIHAHTLSDILLKINPSCIFTQISPDEPFFIRKQKKKTKSGNRMVDITNANEAGYKKYWYSFMRKSEKGEFYVNPGPHYLTDTMLLKNKTDRIIDENLRP